MVIFKSENCVKTTSPTSQNTLMRHLEHLRSSSNSHVDPRTSRKRFHRLRVHNATVAARAPNRTQSDATRAHGLVPTHCPTPRQPQTTARRARGRSEPHRACHDCVAATPTTTGAHAPHRMCGHLHTFCGDGGGGGGGGMVGNVEEEGPPPPGLIPDPTFVERCDA